MQLSFGKRNGRNRDRLDSQTVTSHKSKSLEFTMNTSRSIFAVPFASIIVISTLMTGCMGSGEPEAATESVEEALVNESGELSIPTQDEVRVERAGDSEALSLVPNVAWRELAPGVFENEAQEGGNRIIVGADGHKWAIAQAEKELADLNEQSAVNGDEDPAILGAIEKVNEQIVNLEETARNIAGPVGTPQAVSCNIGFYTGPSSPITGYYGASALAQVSCTGGCQTFTIAAQSCTNFGCTPVYASSRFVCATAWTYGVSRSGTYGASCSSAASISPPGITSSWYGFCG
jgi:hypothetical protein